MLRFLADENLNRNMIRGIVRAAEIDIVRAQDVGLAASDDPTILEWAAAQDRVVVSHDVTTLVQFAWQRVAAELPMPGLIVVPPSCAIAQVISEILLIDRVCNPDDIARQIWYLPLR